MEPTEWWLFRGPLYQVIRATKEFWCLYIDLNPHGVILIPNVALICINSDSRKTASCL